MNRKGTLEAFIDNGYRHPEKIIRRIIKPIKLRPSKYVNIYGITLREMVERFGGNPAKYTEMHYFGELEDFLRKKMELRDSLCNTSN